MKTTLPLLLGIMALSASAGEKDVLVINSEADPVPVMIQSNAVQPLSVTVFESVNEPQSSFIRVEAYQVPAGKILIAEYVSMYLDIAVTDRPSTGLKIEGTIAGTGTPSGNASFELGYMEEFERTSRGTPNFIIAKNLTAYFSEGPVICIADSHFAGTDLDFGVMSCSIAGRLIDAPHIQ